MRRVSPASRGARPRLVIHIGMHKTGSSAIQRFLSRNRWLLRLAGVHYPRATGPDGRRLSKHNDLFLAISHEKDHARPHPVLGPAAGRVARLAAGLPRAGTSVISAEGLSGEDPAFARALAPLAEVAGGVRVVCVLRHPLSWLPAFHAQMVLSREVRMALPLDAFAALPETRAHLDYCAILDWWADSFGQDRLRVVVHDTARPVLPDFLAAAGLPGWLVHLPHGRARVNPTPPPGRIEAVRRANAAGRPLPPPDRVAAAPPGLSEGAARALMAELAPGLETIRRRFRPDLPQLFADPPAPPRAQADTAG